MIIIDLKFIQRKSSKSAYRCYNSCKFSVILDCKTKTNSISESSRLQQTWINVHFFMNFFPNLISASFHPVNCFFLNSCSWCNTGQNNTDKGKCYPPSSVYDPIRCLCDWQGRDISGWLGKYVSVTPLRNTYVILLFFLLFPPPHVSPQIPALPGHSHANCGL